MSNNTGFQPSAQKIGSLISGEGKLDRLLQKEKGLVSNFGTLTPTASLVNNAFILRRRDFTTPTPVGSAKTFTSTVFRAGIGGVSDATIASADIVAAEWTAGTIFKVLDSVLGNDGIYHLQSVVNGTLTLTGTITAFPAGIVYTKSNVHPEGPIDIRMEQVIVGSLGFNATDNFVVDDGSGAGPVVMPTATATYLTVNDETAVLTNSRRVLAGTNITFNDATPGQRTISTDTWGTRILVTDNLVSVNGGAALTTGEKNTLLGEGAGDSITTSIRNVAVGFQPLKALTTTATGNSNIAIGENAMVDAGSLSAGNVIGDDNIGIGTLVGWIAGLIDNCIFIGNNAAGFGEITGDGHIYIGEHTGYNTTAGDRNLAIGSFSMGRQNVTGSDNVCLGTESGADLKSGNFNVCVGANAGANVQTMGTGVIIGYNALSTGLGNCFGLVSIGENSCVNSTTCNYSVAIGAGTMGTAVTTGVQNVGMGYLTLKNLTSGAQNTALGPRCMEVGTVTGSYNVSIGVNAGNNISTASSNTFVGNTAGNVATTGGSNVCIGVSSNVDVNSRIGAVAIGNAIVTAAADSSFSVIHRTIAAGTACSFTGNELHADTSSIRYKENVGDYEPDLDKFMEIRPRTFCMKMGSESLMEPDRVYAGLIAEELETLYPEFITYEPADFTKYENGDMPKGDYETELLPESVMYAHLVTLLIKQVQAQQRRIEALEQRVLSIPLPDRSVPYPARSRRHPTLVNRADLPPSEPWTRPPSATVSKYALFNELQRVQDEADDLVREEENKARDRARARQRVDDYNQWIDEQGLPARKKKRYPVYED